jgi:hypothetical protein
MIELNNIVEEFTDSINKINKIGSIKPPYLEMVCEKYHYAKVKLLGLHSVTGRSEQLQAIEDLQAWLEQNTSKNNEKTLQDIINRL